LERLDELKAAINGSEYILILCHDYPDPDCLASAAGLQFLFKIWKKTSVISYGGFIGRAENRAMVLQLGIEALPLAGLNFPDFERVILVDTQPGAGNHSLPAELSCCGAIDHHRLCPGTENLPFHDVRVDVGASSTIVTEYLRKAKVEINYKLATALYYGVKTDTQDLGRETSALDREVYHYLFSRIDHRLLVQVENPPLNQDFFRTIIKAVRGLEITETRGWCYLGKITRPDLVAEIADLQIRIQDLEWVVCLGYLKNLLYFSIRTKDMKGEAGEVARKLVAGESGSAGGHGQIGAGRVTYHAPGLELLRRMKERYFEHFADTAKPEEGPK
jgi:nanoRNase/pAp phosphatase (c-di-AMP/oligoRNAs hydrolase)